MAMKLKRAKHKLAEVIDYEAIYATHIKDWFNLSEEDKELCRRVNKYRVEALQLPPIIHPDVVQNNMYL